VSGVADVRPSRLVSWNGIHSEAPAVHPPSGNTGILQGELSRRSCGRPDRGPAHQQDCASVKHRRSGLGTERLFAHPEMPRNRLNLPCRPAEDVVLDAADRGRLDFRELGLARRPSDRRPPAWNGCYAPTSRAKAPQGVGSRTAVVDDFVTSAPERRDLHPHPVRERLGGLAVYPFQQVHHRDR
jgi:hypothetical protein